MADPKAQTVPTLAPATLVALGRGLGGFYVETLERPVPDQLLAILQRLEGPTFIAGAAHEKDQAGTSLTAIAN